MVSVVCCLCLCSFLRSPVTSLSAPFLAGESELTFYFDSSSIASQHRSGRSGDCVAIVCQMGTTTSRYTGQNDDGASPSKKQHRFAASSSRRRRIASKTTSSSTAATAKAATKAMKMTKNSSPTLKSSTTQQATLLSGDAGDVSMTQQKGRIPLESVARSNDAAEGGSAKEKSSSSRGDGVENEVNKTPIDPPGALWSQQPAFQPVWGPPAPSVGGNGRSSWAMAMPPFLAPIAATVRHPFSHFSGPTGHGHFPY